MTTDPASSATFRRTTSAILAAIGAAALLAGSVLAQGGVAPQLDEQPAGTELAGVPESSTDLAADTLTYGEVMGDLHSEYLREIAAEWGLPGTPGSSSVEPGQLNSEYLREIAADW